MNLDNEELRATREKLEKKCKNCKYFRKYEFDYFGKCYSEKYKCEGEFYDNTKKWRDKNTDYLIYGYDGFDVGQDFGCIHFTEKEE